MGEVASPGHFCLRPYASGASLLSCLTKRVGYAVLSKPTFLAQHQHQHQRCTVLTYDLPPSGRFSLPVFARRLGATVNERAALLALQPHSWCLGPLTRQRVSSLCSALGCVRRTLLLLLQTSDQRRLDSFSLPRDASREFPFPEASAAKALSSLGALESQRTREEKLSTHPTPKHPWAMKRVKRLDAILHLGPSASKSASNVRARLHPVKSQACAADSQNLDI
jgi:hypothetical protein